MQAEDIVKVFPELKDKFVCKTMYVIKCKQPRIDTSIVEHTLWASFDIEALKYILKTIHFNHPEIYEINIDSTVIHGKHETIYITEEPLYVGIE